MIHYAIQDHGAGANLPQLVSLLEGPGVSIDVSFDAADGALENLSSALGNQGPALSLRRSPSVSWSGTGIHTEMIEAMDRALQLPDWTYFINASGSCLPLRSPAWAQQLLEEQAAQGWLGFCDCYRLGKPLAWISSQMEPAAPKRCFSHEVYGRARLLVDPCLQEMVEEKRLDPARNIGQRVGLMYTEVEKNTYWVRPLSPAELEQRARFLAEQPLRYGRSWLVLHRSIVEWLLGSTILERALKFMAGCFCTDELIFAMTLYSPENPFLAAMCPDNLRHRQGGPQRIPLEEIPAILATGDRLMARKIAAADYSAAAELVRRFNADPVPPRREDHSLWFND